MSKEADDFRMGFMLNHERTMELLELALAIELTPEDFINKVIDASYVAMMEELSNVR